MARHAPSGHAVLTFQPVTGTFGTRVYVKLSSPYGLFLLSTPGPIQTKGSDFIYICASAFGHRLSEQQRVLSLLLKGPSGEEIPRIPVGTSEYLKPSGDESTRPTTMLEPEGVETASTIDHPSIPPKALGISSTSDSNGAPQLVRTSIITTNSRNNTSNHPNLIYSDKVALKFPGKLESMDEEWANCHRLVHFRNTQKKSTANTTCHSASASNRPANSIFDAIDLLEQLVAVLKHLHVKEKDHTHRKLEGFLSKTKPDNQDFFKIIMRFPNPKLRNIKKEVKAFP
ncbi:uncharacterized protein FMAN_14137 [Fusarium mangiferae]|uniref:DUF7082 domain-containing protein n=1 Tax=Fusarium mangiferae TaxID=192010 RepID=A0A1L7UIM1_FUSMA|nr:uncharacterized protein FMAN_14137 [Fusarium mangiferae]CVL08243.1 uncharacterized protein FMAN_14137 [Fusarium mangiferae]